MGGYIVNNKLEILTDGIVELFEENQNVLAADERARKDKVLVNAILSDEILDGGEVVAVDAIVESPDDIRSGLKGVNRII